MNKKKIYILSVRFADMKPGESTFLTEAGQPVFLTEEEVGTYVGYIKDGEGCLGDLFEAHPEWDVAEVFAHEVGEAELK